MDNHTEQLGDGVWRIEVAAFVNVFLLAGDGRSDDGGLTLVDTGTRRAGPRLVRSIRLLGFDPRRVDDVVLTHWHADHTGSAARFRESSATPAVHVGRRDLPAVSGAQRRPQLAARWPDVTRLGRVLGRFSGPGPPVHDARPLTGGDGVPGVPGALVVDSPGHTPGHISVHLPRAGVLIAGDAVWNIGWLSRGLAMARSARSHDADSLARLAALDFDVLAVGHGPPVVTNARDRLARVASRAAGAGPRAAT